VVKQVPQRLLWEPRPHGQRPWGSRERLAFQGRAPQPLQSLSTGLQTEQMCSFRDQSRNCSWRLSASSLQGGGLGEKLHRAKDPQMERSLGKPFC
jgi:hypothetical protein